MRFVGGLIAKNTDEDALCFRLSNDALSATEEVKIDIYRVDASSNCKHRGAQSMAKEAFINIEKQRIYDFEDYLEDPALPWLLPQGEGLARR